MDQQAVLEYGTTLLDSDSPNFQPTRDLIDELQATNVPGFSTFLSFLIASQNIDLGFLSLRLFSQYIDGIQTQSAFKEAKLFWSNETSSPQLEIFRAFLFAFLDQPEIPELVPKIMAYLISLDCVAIMDLKSNLDQKIHLLVLFDLLNFRYLDNTIISQDPEIGHSLLKVISTQNPDLLLLQMKILDLFLAKKIAVVNLVDIYANVKDILVNPQAELKTVCMKILLTVLKQNFLNLGDFGEQFLAFVPISSDLDSLNFWRKVCKISCFKTLFPQPVSRGAQQFRSRQVFSFPDFYFPKILPLLTSIMISEQFDVDGKPNELQIASSLAIDFIMSTRPDLFFDFAKSELDETNPTNFLSLVCIAGKYRGPEKDFITNDIVERVLSYAETPNFHYMALLTLVFILPHLPHFDSTKILPILHLNDIKEINLNANLLKYFDQTTALPLYYQLFELAGDDNRTKSSLSHEFRRFISWKKVHFEEISFNDMWLQASMICGVQSPQILSNTLSMAIDKFTPDLAQNSPIIAIIVNSLMKYTSLNLDLPDNLADSLFGIIKNSYQNSDLLYCAVQFKNVMEKMTDDFHQELFNRLVVPPVTGLSILTAAHLLDVPSKPMKEQMIAQYHILLKEEIDKEISSWDMVEEIEELIFALRIYNQIQPFVEEPEKQREQILLLDHLGQKLNRADVREEVRGSFLITVGGFAKTCLRKNNTLIHRRGITNLVESLMKSDRYHTAALNIKQKLDHL